MTIIPYIFINYGNNYISGRYAITNRSELEEFQSDPAPEVITLPSSIHFEKISKVYPENIEEKMSNFIHDELANYFKGLPNFNDWKNKYLNDLCSHEQRARRISSDEYEQLKNISIENAYVYYEFSGSNTDEGCNVYVHLRYIFFYSPDITSPAECVETAEITKAKTYYYYSKLGRTDKPSLGYLAPIYKEEIQERLYSESASSKSWFAGFYHEDFGGWQKIETEDNGGYLVIFPNDYSTVALGNTSDYHNLTYGLAKVPQITATSTLCEPAVYPLRQVTLSLGSSFYSKPSFGVIKLSDLTYHNVIEETGEDTFWGWDETREEILGGGRTRTIRKGPLFEVDFAKWKCVPRLGSYLQPQVQFDRAEYRDYIKDDDKLYFDIELADKTINYKGENYEITNGVAKNVPFNMSVLKGDSTNKLLDKLYIPLWAYAPNKSVSINLVRLPKHFYIYSYSGKKSATLGWLNTVKIPSDSSFTWELGYTEKPQYGQLNFSLNFTGMGNDPCKECCCDCEIEPKKYKTVVAFTSREVLKDRAIITPETLEYEWQDNTLILMLEKDQEVTVDNLPVGTKYEISLDMDGEEYDECDKNEYSIENSSGTVGENSESEEEEETEIVINAQAGETIQQYLDRLRQRGYEQLAENLKLENVEFTLQDERIKLGDLVTVDLPEFDFKAVVRVTGVKIKSQGNQTIRTISVGTPLKILRRSKI